MSTTSNKGAIMANTSMSGHLEYADSLNVDLLQDFQRSLVAASVLGTQE